MKVIWKLDQIQQMIFEKLHNLYFICYLYFFVSHCLLFIGASIVFNKCESPDVWGWTA